MAKTLAEYETMIRIAREDMQIQLSVATGAMNRVETLELAIAAIQHLRDAEYPGQDGF